MDDLIIFMRAQLKYRRCFASCIMKETMSGLGSWGRFGFRDFIGYAISALLLWYTLDKSGMKLSSIRADGWQFYYFVAAVLVFVFSLVIYAYRAKLIWRDRSKPVQIRTYASLILGNFYNCLLPGNLGEGVRAYHFSRRNNISFSRSLAALITEKWLDAQVFAVMVVLLFTCKPFEDHYISYVLAYIAGAIFICTAIHRAMRRYRVFERQVWQFALGFRRPAMFLFKLYYHTNCHLDHMKKNRMIRPYVFLFGVVFILNVLQFYLLQMAAGVSAPVAGFYSSTLVSLSMMIIAFLPSAPSNVGVLHYGVYSVLLFCAMQCGVNADADSQQHYALFATYVHLSFLIPELILGLVFITVERKAIFGSMVRT